MLTGATKDMQLAGEETFGPVAPLFRFETEEEAIALANGTPYGLASYFYTENLKRAWRVGEALEFGMVGSTPARSRSRSPPSAASSCPASAERERRPASRNISR